MGPTSSLQVSARQVHLDPLALFVTDPSIEMSGSGSGDVPITVLEERGSVFGKDMFDML